MHTRPLRRSTLAALALSSLLAACGGGGDGAPTALASAAGEANARALKGGECTGSCTGGGGTPVAGTNPLPTTAPAPDILVRESFGPGPEGVRPKGGKGDLRSTFIGTTLGGFWVEWPGDKNRAWITSAGEATWKFSSVTMADGSTNPYELPSPLQAPGTIGMVGADVTDGATAGYPSALLPVTWPTTAWSMSIEATPSNMPGGHIALGVTDSGATLGNLATAAKLSLFLRQAADGSSLRWELWQGGAARTLMASGNVEDVGFNQLRLSYDPSTLRVSVHVNGVFGGTFAINLGVPRYAAFEGHGGVDNFVLRKLGTGAL